MNLKNKNQLVSLILSLLLLFALINSGYFFMGMLKLSILKWLSFNACSLAIIVYLICFALFRKTRNDLWLAIPILPLYYYGTMGLFVMPWNEANIVAQITHVIISINIIWLLYQLLKEHKFEPLGKGLLIGILVFVPVFAWIQSFSQAHMSEFMEALQKI